MIAYKAIFLLSIVAVLVHCDKNPQTGSSQNDLMRKQDATESEDVEIGLWTVMRNKRKCSSIAKKKRKSFSDKVYYKMRCSRSKRRKPKAPKRPKRPKMLKTPKLPKLPNVPKLPNLPKLPKAPKIPKLEIPKIPKINPKAIPKVPTLTLITPRLKASPSPRPKKKSGKSSKRRTSKRKSNKRGKKTKKKPTPKRRKKSPSRKPSKPQPRPSPTPTPTPTPRPRQRPRPRRKVESPSKVRSSFASAKKRISNNIAKQEKKASKPRVCKTEEYKCGKKCSGRSGPRFLCYYPNNVPKMCTRKAIKPGFCAGQARVGKTCKRTILEPATCTRNVTITEYCPGAEQGCKFNEVPFGRCLPNKQADECERIKRRKCSYDKRVVTAACQQPETTCNDCKSGFIVKTCPKTVMERVEVPCKGGVTQLPSFDEEVLGSGIESRYVRDLLCFDSFFDEEVCKESPRVCKLFDELFDRHLCAGVVCQQCAALMGMIVSDEIKNVCRSLLDSTCYAADAFPEVKEVETKQKCFVNRRVTRELPCYEPVQKGSICAKGCVTKACKKTIHDVKGFCERNVPEKCHKIGKAECKRETRLVKDCSEERICEYVVQKRFVCFKERTVDIPCTGACDVEDVEEFVCGSEIEEVEAICREQFEFHCKDVKCSRQVCK